MTGKRWPAVALLSLVTVLVVTGIISRPADGIPGQPIKAAADPAVPSAQVSSADLQNLSPLVPPFAKVIGFHGDGKVAYLTFDDGPGPDTAKVLDALDAADAKATFCQVGNRIDDYFAIEQRIVADGHTLCNHSWTHPDDLAAASPQEINDEISRTQEKFRSFGVTVHYFRAPGGAFGEQTTTLRQVAQLNSVVPLGWGVDSLDWKKPGTQAIVNQVLSTVQPGAIILMHDAGGTDRSQTIAAIPGIVSGLRAAGYTLSALPPQGIS